MSGKSLETWCKKWDELPGSDFAKATELLFEYSGSYKKHPARNDNYVWGGAKGRFLTFRWNTHHGDAVEKTLSEFHNDYATKYENETDRTVVELIEILNRNLRDSQKTMNVEGDLYRIIKTMMIKSGTCAKRLSVISDSENEGTHPLYLLPKGSYDRVYRKNNPYETSLLISPRR